MTIIMNEKKDDSFLAYHDMELLHNSPKLQDRISNELKPKKKNLKKLK